MIDTSQQDYTTFTRYKFDPNYFKIMRIMLVVYLTYCAWFETRWIELSSHAKMRLWTVYFITVGCLIDTTIALVIVHVGWFTSFSIPIIVLLTSNNLRNNFSLIIYLTIDSVFIIAMIFVFLICYAGSGYLLFFNSFEGYTTFHTMGTSIYQMFILLTTANFPDVMLLSYYFTRLSSLYFIGFLVLSLYFLMNILLATVYNNYK